MLRFVLFDTTCFDSDDDREQTELDLCWFMEALTQRNQSYLSRRPSTPRIYKSGVVWEKPAQFNGDPEEVAVLRKALGSAARSRDVKRALDMCRQVLGGERFRDIGRILEKGAGDCDNLACWRAAELRQMGIPARTMMTSRQRPDGGITYHAIVRWPPFGDEISGNPYEETDEDPSLLLGMAQPQRTAEREEEKRKNLERCDYIRRCQMRGVGFGTQGSSVVEDVLGLRRGPLVDQMLARLFRRAA